MTGADDAGVERLWVAVAERERALKLVAEVHGLYQGAGRVANAMAKLERVGEAAVCRRRQAGCEVGAQDAPRQAAHAPIGDEPVVGDAEHLPLAESRPLGRIDRATDRRVELPRGYREGSST